MPFTVPPRFLWGASTSGHQTEGNNVSSDWWGLETAPGTFVTEPSGDAVDSFHRWTEDMDLLAEAGFTDYRFGIEWARIEPAEGLVSRAAVAHYRAMVKGAVERGLRPLVTLHHFTSPRWFSEQGGWMNPKGVERFTRFVDMTEEILQDEVAHVCTINEPNMVAIYTGALAGAGVDSSGGLPAADPALTERLIEAHQAAREVLHRNNPGTKVGWSVAMQAVEPLTTDDQPAARAFAAQRETRFVEAAADDDWFGVQSYTRLRVRASADGPRTVPLPEHAERTLMGWEYYPAALGNAVREASRVLGDVPIIVTENGIATADDDQRIAYTGAALEGLRAAMDDGIRVDGYFHWSLLDNYEWGDYRPTFGLIAVDRSTFERKPRPSLSWLGGLPRAQAVVA
ncbi:family 1 glycosylhydrolase [Streptomyces nodosus]|uniref:glycoside hydrolase family 1 protein n=1 Tax=Streptomyces nodosus TaxID=40318 RepID=UPI0034516CEA